MIEDLKQHIGALTVAIEIPGARSLKAKRMVLRSVKGRVRTKFNVSVAELDGQDKWQRSVIGFVMVSCDRRYIETTLQKLLSFLESFGTFYICEQSVEYF